MNDAANFERRKTEALEGIASELELIRKILEGNFGTLAQQARRPSPRPDWAGF